jgi:xanthosine utilization system XapX-like protein
MSWILAILGIIGMVCAGKKYWWAWLILGSNEILWIIYAITTKQYGFILGAIGYIIIHQHNARAWKKQKPSLPLGPNWLDESDWTRVDL